MIVREERALSGPIFYAACRICGWCSRPTVHEDIAGAADDAHLAAKLAAQRRAKAFAPPMPGPRR